MKRLVYGLLGLFLAGIIGSCANRVAPTGGKKDTEPPQVISVEPANMQTGFDSREITLTFNEYVQLKDAQKQIMISPPVDPAPRFEVRKKSLVISLPPTLSPQTTYTLSFGTAVSDFTEGNVLPDYQYVFSTGDAVDSLKMNGKILDALTRQPVKGTLALVYPAAIADSMIGKVPPAYYGKSTDDGSFTVRNIRKGMYRVAALEDKNNNLTHENADESLGVSANVLQLDDSATVEVLINRQPPAKQSVKSARLEIPGKLITAFARPVRDPDAVFIGTQPGKTMTWFNDRRDTVVIYCETPYMDSARIAWRDKNIVIDTVLYRPERGTAAGAQKTMKTLTAVQGIVADSLTEPYIRWASPIRKIDYSAIGLKRDSLVQEYKGYFRDSFNLVSYMDAVWQEGNYSLTVLPGAAEDIYGRSNDTIRFGFSIPSERSSGSIAYQFITGKEGPLLLQLVNEKFELIRQRETDGSQRGVFGKLNPGVYRLRVISDANNNKRWDEGIVREHIFPEAVHYYSGTITVRANWEVELEWKE